MPSLVGSEMCIRDSWYRGRKNKTWIDNVKEDLQQRGSDMRQAAERVKDRKQWKKFVHVAHRLQLTVKTDGSKKEEVNSP